MPVATDEQEDPADDGGEQLRLEYASSRRLVALESRAASGSSARARVSTMPTSREFRLVEYVATLVIAAKTIKIVPQATVMLIERLGRFSRVATSGLSADNGVKSGASVNAVTKSGTNVFHGGGFEFLRDRRPDPEGHLNSFTTPVIVNLLALAGLRLPIESHSVQAFVTEGVKPVIDVFDRPIAEFVVAAVLAHAKRLHESRDLQRDKVWRHRETRTVVGARALIVGTGAIGRETARLLRAVGLEVRGAGRTARMDDIDFGEVVASADLQLRGTFERPLLFAVVQGGASERLRRQCATELAAIGFDGYAVGGLSLGESREEMLETLALTAPMLPAEKPRYFMGIGDPVGILKVIALGVDMFDSVLPTRLARHGAALTQDGRINLKNARYRTDFGQLDPGCACEACAGYSRAYLAHLVRENELLGHRLVTLHNVRFSVDLCLKARREIEAGRYEEWSRAWIARYDSTDRAGTDKLE